MYRLKVFNVVSSSQYLVSQWKGTQHQMSSLIGAGGTDEILTNILEISARCHVWQVCLWTWNCPFVRGVWQVVSRMSRPCGDKWGYSGITPPRHLKPSVYLETADKRRLSLEIGVWKRAQSQSWRVVEGLSLNPGVLGTAQLSEPLRNDPCCPQPGQMYVSRSTGVLAHCMSDVTLYECFILNEWCILYEQCMLYEWCILSGLCMLYEWCMFSRDDSQWFIQHSG